MAGDWIKQVNDAISAASKIPEKMPMTLDNLAYVVYSSGTTGKPKGMKKSNADTELSSNSVNSHYIERSKMGMLMFKVACSLFSDQQLACTGNHI